MALKIPKVMLIVVVNDWKAFWKSSNSSGETVGDGEGDGWL
jgi:hypothetical protein